MQHRFVVVLRGENICDKLSDSDPLVVGNPPLEIKPLCDKAEFTAKVANKFFNEVREIIKDLKPANSILMRGFSAKPRLPSLHNRFKLNPVCLAVYPMYKGLSRLAGMTVIDEAGSSVEELFKKYVELHNKYNYFFIHVKYTDSNGEDGNFAGKAKIIEEVDNALPIIMQKMPNVLCITGDHSTPAAMKAHSWHHIPVMIHSNYCGADGAVRFTENECNGGGLGTFESRYLMNYLLANAMKLSKYGA
jgi:2,3-bisphosphoglycerate-independent phosphoglycerate mutase